MDLRQYYRKIREVEANITDEFPLLASLATEDGGRAGVVSEVSRHQAARLIVEGKARPASEEEKQGHFERLSIAQKAAEELDAARRVHMNLLLSAEQRIALPKLKPAGK